MKKIIIIILRTFTFNLLFINIFAINSHVQAGWFQQNSGTNERLNSCFFINQNTGWVTSQYGNLIKTTDGGNTWSNIQNLSSNSLFDIFFIDEFTGWIAGRERVWKTTNTGINWVQSDTIAGGYLNSLYFINNNTGWVVGDYAIRKTTNGGLNWFNQWHYDNILSHDLQSVMFSNSLTGLVVGCCEIKKTTDGGASWIDVDTINQLNSIYTIDVNQSWAVGAYGKIYKTTNSGNNWYAKTSNITKTFYSVYFLDNNIGWIAGGTFNDSDGVILKTTNSGNNWSNQIGPLNKTIRSLFFINGNTGWAVGEYGKILKTINGGVGINQISSEIPSSYSLKQNYPNPFNPSTNVRYQIPNNSFVKLIVFDALGREMETLVNEKQSAGTYEATFNSSQYPSGIYFYRLTTEGFSETKKMILIK
jgi:photosystem II stability/assembly factor-like uncharacterized protein